MILILTPYATDNAAQCEQMLEFIFAQNDRQQLKAHILLVNHPKVDREMKARIKISAELAFSGVHELELRALVDERAPKWKEINNYFVQAATHISKCFRWPFFVMEPDCVPTRRGWFSRLVTEYASQPKVYFGSRLKISTEGKPDGFLMARNGIYPVNSITDLPAAEAPFEIASSGNVLPKFTVTKLIQQLVINGEADLVKVREDAILVHGDKAGVLRRKLEQEFELRVESLGLGLDSLLNAPTMKTTIPVFEPPPQTSEGVPINGAPKKRGRPTKAAIAARTAAVAASFSP